MKKVTILQTCEIPTIGLFEAGTVFKLNELGGVYAILVARGLAIVEDDKEVSFEKTAKKK